jgi:hypothetical protein
MQPQHFVLNYPPGSEGRAHGRRDKPNGSHAPFPWGRSPQFRAVTSNHLRYRFAPGEVALIFGRFADTPGGSTVGIEEEASVSVSWPHLKLVATILSEAVAVLEAELGPIAMPANLDPATIRAGLEVHVRSLNLAAMGLLLRRRNGRRPEARNSPDFRSRGYMVTTRRLGSWA